MKHVSYSTIAKHPNRAAIEMALASNIPLQRLAERYDVSTSALHRYKKAVPPQLIAALRYRVPETSIDLEALQRSESESLLHHLIAIRGQLYAHLNVCNEHGDRNGAARIASQLHRNLELTGELLGDLTQGDRHLHIHLQESPA